MTKCINNCADPAEQNFTWPTSAGPMSANFCGICASAWWAKYKNTEAGFGLTVSEVKSKRELEVFS